MYGQGTRDHILFLEVLVVKMFLDINFLNNLCTFVSFPQLGDLGWVIPSRILLFTC